MNADQRMRLRAVLFPAMAQVRAKMRPLRQQANELAEFAESTDYNTVDLDALISRLRQFQASIKEFHEAALPVMDEALAETRTILQEPTA